MQVQNMEDQIKNFIVQHFPLAHNRRLNNDEELLESGMLDSLGILEVVTFLEGALGIYIDDVDLLPENFHTISCIATFANNKLGVVSTDSAGQ